MPLWVTGLLGKMEKEKKIELPIIWFISLLVMIVLAFEMPICYHCAAFCVAFYEVGFKWNVIYFFHKSFNAPLGGRTVGENGKRKKIKLPISWFISLSVIVVLAFELPPLFFPFVDVDSHFLSNQSSINGNFPFHVVVIHHPNQRLKPLRDSATAFLWSCAMLSMDVLVFSPSTEWSFRSSPDIPVMIKLQAGVRWKIFIG